MELRVQRAVRRVDAQRVEVEVAERRQIGVALRREPGRVGHDGQVVLAGAVRNVNEWKAESEAGATPAGLFTLFTLLAYLNYTLQTPNRSTEPSDSL